MKNNNTPSDNDGLAKTPSTQNQALNANETDKKQSIDSEKEDKTTQQPEPEKNNHADIPDKKTATSSVADECPQSDDKPPQPQVQVIKKGGGALSALSLSLVIALGGAGFYFNQEQTKQYHAEISRLHTLIKQTNETNEGLQAETARLDNNQTSVKKKLNANIERANQASRVLIEQQQNSITSLQNALSEMTGQRPNDWLLAETEHLIKQAGRQIWLEKDIRTATMLMETADQRVADLNDPSLTHVRQAIANDIQQLRAIKIVDTDVVVLRLIGLQQQIATLPLANAILPEETTVKTEAKVSTDVNDWQQNLKTSLTEFVDQFVTYRHRKGSVTPLLTPDQTFYLQENVRTKLDQAIAAVFREKQGLYEEALAVAQDWISQYYSTESPATQSVLSELQTLQSEQIEVSYPDQLSSLQVVGDVLSERVRRNIARQSSKGESL